MVLPNTPGRHQTFRCAASVRSQIWHRWSFYLSRAKLDRRKSRPFLFNRRFEAMCYSFYDVRRDLAMRLCRIQDGRYKISIHSDQEGNGNAGDIIWETEKDLRRFDVVTVPVPPQTPVVIRVEQIKKHDRPAAMPDLAVDSWDVVRSGTNITVLVHNIGNAPAKDIVVRLVDGENTIENRMIESLDPPTDFVPKKMAVTFTKVPESRDMKVIVDPNNAVMEIMEENNEVKLGVP